MCGRIFSFPASSADPDRFQFFIGTLNSDSFFLSSSSSTMISSETSSSSSPLSSTTSSSTTAPPTSTQSFVIDLPHNPYIGFFHGTLRLRSLNSNRLYLPTSNPHVGILRHAPSNVSSQSSINKEKSTNNTTTITHVLSQLKIDRKKILQDLDANIPRSQFSSRNSRFGDQPTCMICLDPIIDGDEIRNLKCSHCFHSKCVDIWLLGTLSDEFTNTSICPTCRQEAISDHVSVASSDDSPQNSTNSQPILSPRPIYPPPLHSSTSTSDHHHHQPSLTQLVSEFSSNSSNCGSTESNVGFRPQDSDIPREVFMRVGQYLLDEGTVDDTPSPLMSPVPDHHSNILISNPLSQVIIPPSISDIHIQPRSRTSSFSSVSSAQSLPSSTSSSSSSSGSSSSGSSVTSFFSVSHSHASENGSGVYINFSILSNSLDILSIASGE